MHDNIIDRINFLAKKAKTEGLSDVEIKERDSLRQQYLQNFRNNFKSQILENIYFVEEDGTKTKLINEDSSK